jgi:hypothetical protein
VLIETLKSIREVPELFWLDRRCYAFLVPVTSEKLLLILSKKQPPSDLDTPEKSWYRSTFSS